ncbi:EAL domain-containing protein [Chelativorans sp. ZYF759]|uniref:bifunctional diguanylate cyclase/phosphodiesterase n=1 Tax=Chelativorans sp. ZYF759 TaxID=2692213 RepID=UPI0016BD4450|nr:EAL domain-containing protein [Chelativorans sp. ZYF759]NMG39179.1 EAL domain-containing protein [Chelativorans sp. ZYF759]
MSQTSVEASPKRQERNGLFRLSRIPAVLALIVIVGAGLFAEMQNRGIHLKSEQAEVLNDLSLIRARLEGAINGNIQLVRGLVAAIATEPDMTQERFTALSKRLLDRNAQIRNIAAAPGLVVSMTYPLEGNEAVIGLDYTTNAEQLEATLRARDSQEMVLAGPVDLVQGGQGFVARFPVFVPSEHSADHFWGIVSAVIDTELLYRHSGLLDPDIDISVAIIGRDGLGEDGLQFFGDPSVASDEPIMAEVALPAGSWVMKATPLGGWGQEPENSLRLHLWILLAASLIMVPTLLSGRLIDERQRHIRQLKDRELQLEKISRRLGLALETSQVGVWELDIENNVLFWDPRMNELYGYESSGPRDYTHWASVLHPEDKERAEADFAEALRRRGKYHSEYRLVLPGNTIRYIRALGSVYQNPGEPARIVGVNWDVTEDLNRNEELRRASKLTEARNIELEAARTRVEFTAMHDALTGLPNRRYLDEVLAEHAVNFQHGERAALLHVDLDRFKQINDTLGHPAGDSVLIHAAKILTTCAGSQDFVARVGGDEFVVVCRRDTGSPDLHSGRLSDLAEEIIAGIRDPILYEGHQCRCGASVGIAVDTDGIADPSRLLVNADIALYRAKAQGRNGHQFFTDSLQNEIVRTKKIADDILSGIDRGEFTAWFQPQVDAVTHEIIGVEALARWNHPTEGVLPPGAFLKIADELNVVGTIDRIVLEETTGWLAKWQAAGLDLPKASVNVSARRLNDEGLIESLRGMSITPGTLSFELVESIFLDEHDDLLSWNVESVKDLGIDIEIDDFGTGYASIVSLLNLKPKRLKIDRQLILPIVRSPSQRQLVGSIIDIGKSLGIEVLAEGVETLEHARILRQLGCQYLQGFAFARPMCGDEVVEFVRSRRWLNAS